jgi:hypothetical protein
MLRRGEGIIKRPKVQSASERVDGKRGQETGKEERASVNGRLGLTKAMRFVADHPPATCM